MGSVKFPVDNPKPLPRAQSMPSYPREFLEFALNRVLGILAKEVQDTISMSLTHLLAGEEPMFPLTFKGEVDSSPNWFP